MTSRAASAILAALAALVLVLSTHAAERYHGDWFASNTSTRRTYVARGATLTIVAELTSDDAVLYEANGPAVETTGPALGAAINWIVARRCWRIDLTSDDPTLRAYWRDPECGKVIYLPLIPGR